MFVLQSRYDLWQQQHVLAPQPPPDAAVQRMGDALAGQLRALVAAPGPRLFGAVLDACAHHCGNYWNNLTASGARPSEAFAAFWAAVASGRAPVRRFWSQDAAFPCASCCSNSNATAALRVSLKA